ncbi:MAG TPA: hypothetical protein VF910_07240 [Candidatus Bathyarchaeia archaeon]
MSKGSTKVIGAVFLILGILMVVAGGIASFERGFINEGRYNLVIGDWAKNAQDAPTFQQSITFLNKFIDGMKSEGLANDTNTFNSPWSWQQTPQNRMDFQYSYTEQMINRAIFYENYTQTQKAGQFTDVYNTALTNFRAEMDHNGPLDWVAHDAWMLKNGYYWTYYYSVPLIISGIIFGLIGGAVVTDDE